VYSSPIEIYDSIYSQISTYSNHCPSSQKEAEQPESSQHQIVRRLSSSWVWTLPASCVWPTWA